MLSIGLTTRDLEKFICSTIKVGSLLEPKGETTGTLLMHFQK